MKPLWRNDERVLCYVIRLDFEVGFCIPYLFQTLLMSRWGVFIRWMEDVESEHQIYGQR